MSIPDRPRVFISYARSDGEKFAASLRRRLEREQPEITLWQDRTRMEGGKDWWKQITEALDVVQFMLLVMTPGAIRSPIVRKEWQYARQRGVCIYPVIGARDLDFAGMPRWMSKAHFYDLDKEWETFVNYLKSPCQTPRVPFMAPDLPEGFVERRAPLTQLLDAVLADGQNPVPGTVALHGAGGFGKTTLAEALCHDDDIITVYDAGILWVTLGEQPNLLGELTKLYVALTDDRRGFVDADDAATHLADRLGDGNYLLVIDDAWNAAHVRPFLRGGAGCTRLVTTRKFDIAAELDRRVEVYEMTRDEAADMLTARLDAPPRDLSPFYALAQRLGEWPLMLELAGGALRQRVARGDTLDGALTYLNKALDKRGVVAFDRTDAAARNQAIAKSIGVSLELLEPRERQRYLELAIFPDDVDIPLTTLGALWDLDAFDTEALAERLSDLSLLRYDLPAGAIRLHDVIRAYLSSQLSDQPSIHAHLLDAWGDPHHLPDDYAWRWVAYHLEKAGRVDQLRSLLLDYDWLQAKLDAIDPNALVADCQRLPEDAGAQRLGRTLRHAAHVLVRDRAQLAGQLLGRLLDDPTPDIQAMLSQVVKSQRTPYLRPLTASLREPEALLRTLEGHTGWVSGVAVTPNGRLAISASHDRTLKVWDVGSGTLLRTLAGHADVVSGVAVTPDGRLAISASDDGTLRVWDVASGAERLTLRGHTGRVSGVAVTADGRTAISASDDRTLKVWDVTSGAERLALRGHTDGVRAVAVTADGWAAISASYDQTLKVWDLTSGQCLATFYTNEAVNACAVAADGVTIVAGDASGRLHFLRLEGVG